MKVAVVPIIIGALVTILQYLLVKEAGKVRNHRASRDYSNDNVAKIAQNTKKNTGDSLLLRELVWKAC